MSKSIMPAYSVRFGIAPLALAVLLGGGGCRTKLNPSLDGFSCDNKGVCWPTDGGLDRGDVLPADADAQVDGADASGGIIVISQPATSPTYTNGTVVVQVAITSATSAPTDVALFKGDTQLAPLTPPAYTFSWDTTAEAEATYTLTARAQVAGRAVSSAPITVVVDRTPPTVVPTSRVPAPGASEVALGDPVQLAFSEPIQSASAPTAVVLSQSSGPIATKATLAADGKSLAIAIVDRSVVALSTNAPATLTATISSAVTDLAGNAIVTPPQWSWTVPFWLDFGSVLGEEPSLTIDSTGTPFVSTAFEPGAIGSYIYNLKVSRHLHGQTWDSSYGTPETPGSTIVSSSTSIAIATDGRPIMAWSERPMGGTSAVHVAHSTASGWDTTYSGLAAVADTGGVGPSLVSGAGGALSIAWAGGDIYVASWTGSAWSPFPALGAIGATTPVLRMRSPGEPIVGWISGSSASGVSAWTGQAWMTTNYPSSYSSNLALDKTGRPVVAFADGGSIRVRYADTSEEFATAISAGTQPSGVDIAIDSMNRALVVWFDKNTSTPDLQVARWTGTEWDTSFGPLSALPAAGTSVAAPVVVIDATDSPIVAWRETDPYRSNTYVRKSNR